MSLFSAKTFWSASLDDDKLSDGGLAVVDGKLVTGSLSGFVRVHNPEIDLEAASLLFEKRLEDPVLELCKIDGESLAILHPFRVAVYDFAEVDESSHQLALRYSLRLGDHFSAHSMCVGYFGNEREEMKILVQSMDCKIVVFDRGAEAFRRTLGADSLLPGPLVHLRQSDTFVTTTSSHKLVSYKYDVVVAANQENVLGGATADTPRRNVSSEWAIDLGETLIYLKVATVHKTSVVVALGESGIFVVSSSGKLIAQRLLDFEAVAPCVYEPDVKGADGDSYVILGSTDGRLAILELATCQTLWVARSPIAPLAIAICDLTLNRAGMIAVLDDAGRKLDLLYLGTEPAADAGDKKTQRDEPLFPRDKRSYAQLFDEMKRLKATLHSNRNNSNKRQSPHPPASSSPSVVVARAQVPSSLDDEEHHAFDVDESTSEIGLVRQPPLSEFDDEEKQPLPGPLVSLTVRISLSGGDKLGTKDIVQTTTSIQAPTWIYHDSSPSVLAVKSGGTPQVLSASFCAKENVAPTSMMAQATTSLHVDGRNGGTTVPSCVATSFRLPMCLVCRVSQPKRDALYKLTFGTGAEETVPLTQLFPESLHDHNVTFEFWFRADGGGEKATATILVSKNKDSYRVQATAIPALWIAAEELVRRLREASTVTYNDDLPLADVNAAIDAHHAARRDVRRTEAQLNDAAHELRVVEKRLLVRLKDSRPAPLGKLDTILQMSYGRVLDLATQLQSAQEKREEAGRVLSASINLLLLLVELRFSLAPEEADFLRNHFCLPGALNRTGLDDPHAGFEEITDASLAYLLRTNLRIAEGGNKSHHQDFQQSVAFPKSAEKLKKHIAMVCDRLNRGGRLVLLLNRDHS